jgi:peptidoglycan/xylan/chitin deacetylase (PgdA/CDA1 family)
MRGYQRLQRGVRWIRGRLFRGALILIYHRVAEPALDPFGLAVSPRHFAEQMDVLRKYARPIPLFRLAGEIREGRVPRRGVVVTFDDGYADNLHHARPLLERTDVPATVFIATGSIDDGRGFWWDGLIDLLLRPCALPRDVLAGVVPENGLDHDLGDAWDYGEDDAARFGRWTFADGDPPTPRHALFVSLYAQLQALPGERPAQAVEALWARAGARPAVEGETARALTVRELQRLGDGPLVEVGAHTVHHPLLPSLPATEQRAELAGSKGWLEERLGRAVRSVSYPYGRYTAETAAIAEDAGFSCALAASGAAVQQGSRDFGLFDLPRVWPGDWDGDEFARRLRDWLPA